MVGGVGHAGATPAPPFALPPSLPPAVPLHTNPLFCFVLTNLWKSKWLTTYSDVGCAFPRFTFLQFVLLLFGCSLFKSTLAVHLPKKLCRAEQRFLCSDRTSVEPDPCSGLCYLARGSTRMFRFFYVFYTRSIT